MDMRFGADMHDSFVKYQSRVIQALDRMAKRYDFVVIDATKTPDQIFRELQRFIGKLF
jgi:thymidylate kinase